MLAASNNIRQLAFCIAEEIRRHNIPDSSLEAEVLIRHALQYDRTRFYASLNETISSEQKAQISILLARRLSREPLPYITKHREFYGLDFIVNSAVLIPRQETELLVDLALALTHKQHDSISIADVGTGSGAIAIAVAVNLPSAQVYATDCSLDALRVAACNLQRHGVSNRVSLLEGDLLTPLPRKVNLIVSNPPYIATGLLPGLPAEVQREPHIALDGGEKGLEIIHRLLQQAASKLKVNGHIIIEISPGQLDSVRTTARAYFPTADITYACDLQGLARCVTISAKQQRQP